MATGDPASEAQLRYLDGLTAPDQLARLTSGEARHLISWLRGPPLNMSRGKQLYLSGLLAALPRGEVAPLIAQLRGLVEPAPAPTAEGGPR